MRREPAIYSAYRLLNRSLWGGDEADVPGYGYVPARPLGGMNSRFKLAWMVFTGRADALHWPGQE